MSEPFLGEVRMWACTYAPKDWAPCNGQLLPIAQYAALFSLLGTAYGGNGTTNFAVPRLNGNLPMCAGAGPGLTPRNLGDSGGETTVLITNATLAGHSHTLSAAPDPADQPVPSPVRTFAQSTGVTAYDNAGTNIVPMATAAIAQYGGDQPHNNLMPFQVQNFCIALAGVFPQRP